MRLEVYSKMRSIRWPRRIFNMGQVGKLAEIVGRLSEFDAEATIFASEPWSDESSAMVARGSSEGGPPAEGKAIGLKYFLEISVAKEFAEDWTATLNNPPSNHSLCERLITYAIDDA
jgi:hypothetical protein